MPHRRPGHAPPRWGMESVAGETVLTALCGRDGRRGQGGVGPVAHWTAVIGARRRARNPPARRSARAALDACQPGSPLTPPPACVADEPWYSPAIGVR